MADDMPNEYYLAIQSALAIIAAAKFVIGQQVGSMVPAATAQRRQHRSIRLETRHECAQGGAIATGGRNLQLVACSDARRIRDS
jgi:hypothetical protein